MFKLDPKLMAIGAASLTLTGLALMLFGRKSTKPATTMSKAGLAKLAQDEGRMRKLYNDPLGHCTVGIGHLVHRGNCNGSEPPGFLHGGLPPAGNNTRAPSPTLDEAEMMDLFAQDVAVRERDILRRLNVPVSQPQFDAILSFVYNVGAGGASRRGLFDAINARNFKEAAAILERGTGQALLASRRAEEAAWFRSGPVIA